MIERQIVATRVRHFHIQEYIESKLGKAGYSHTEIQRTPLGDKVVIYTSHPGLVVGRKGENIKELTNELKTRFNMENPQIEVAEIDNPLFDAQLVAKIIVNSLEKFGPKRFKSLGYKTLENIINAGALGAEIIIGGRGVPSSRAKSWRFSAGYLKKSGDVAVTQVKKGYAVAYLKSGAIGIKVSILTPDIKLPDRIVFKEPELSEEKKQEIKEKLIEKIIEPEKIMKEEKSLLQPFEKALTKTEGSRKERKEEKHEHKAEKKEKPKKAKTERKPATTRHVRKKKDGNHKEEGTKANE